MGRLQDEGDFVCFTHKPKLVMEATTAGLVADVPNLVKSDNITFRPHRLVSIVPSQYTLERMLAVAQWWRPPFNTLKSTWKSSGFGLERTPDDQETDFTIGRVSLEVVENSGVDKIWLATGDSDFAPIARFLREQDIDVGFISPDGNTALEIKKGESDWIPYLGFSVGGDREVITAERSANRYQTRLRKVGCTDLTES